MASHEQLQSDLSWDIDRLSVDPGVNASDAALDVLDELGNATAVVAVREYAAGEMSGRVATTYLLRTLQCAEGRLALVTWGSGGIQAVGYLPGDQRFDVGRFSGHAARMGNDPESYDRVARAEAKDELAWCRPSVVRRDESKLLPALDGGGRDGE